MPDLLCRSNGGPMLFNSDIGISVECIVVSKENEEGGVWGFTCIVPLPFYCSGDTAESINATILAGAKAYAETQLDPPAVFDSESIFRLFGGII